MQVIYQPRGAALEYAPLACNTRRGCEHGCSYCYAPACLFLKREQFRAASTPRSGILEALAKDAAKLQRVGNRERVLFCFTCDPYTPAEAQDQTTRRALETMGRYSQPFAVLTKSGTRSCRDFDLLERYGGWFGTTLLFTEDRDRQTWEPRAASVEDRREAIRQAHSLGIRTWVSVEPIIDPEQALALIDSLSPWVDEWRVGKLNHHPHAATVDWNAWAPRLLGAVQASGRDYLVKEALAQYLPKGAAVRRMAT